MIINCNENGTTKLASYEYDAFGNQKSSTGTWNNSNPIRYCGEYYDKESGLIYLRARYYDSENGRFISEDPIKDGYNWYSYCGGNPVMFVDPLGLKTVQLRKLAEEEYGATVTWDDYGNNYAEVSFQYGTSYQFTVNPNDDDSAFLGSDGKMYVDDVVFARKMKISSHVKCTYRRQTIGDVTLIANLFNTGGAGANTLTISLNGKVAFANKKYKANYFNVIGSGISAPYQSNIETINGYRASDWYSQMADSFGSMRTQFLTNIITTVYDFTDTKLLYTDIQVRIGGDYYFFDRYFEYKFHASVIGQFIRPF